MQQQQQRLYVLRYHLCVSSAANVGGLGLAGGGGKGFMLLASPLACIWARSWVGVCSSAEQVLCHSIAQAAGKVLVDAFW